MPPHSTARVYSPRNKTPIFSPPCQNNAKKVGTVAERAIETSKRSYEPTMASAEHNATEHLTSATGTTGEL